MQTVETRRWSGPEAIENLAALESQVVDLTKVVSRHRPGHYHVRENTPAIYIRWDIELPLEQMFDNECIDWQVYLGTREPSIGRWGGGIEHLFNLNTTRFDGRLYKVHFRVWESEARRMKTRMLKAVGPKVFDLVILEKSQNLVTALLAAKV